MASADERSTVSRSISSPGASPRTARSGRGSPCRSMPCTRSSRPGCRAPGRSRRSRRPARGGNPPQRAPARAGTALHFSQRIRARRCATTASIADATRNVSTSISTSRLIADGASFVERRQHEVTRQGGLDRDRGSPCRGSPRSARCRGRHAGSTEGRGEREAGLGVDLDLVGRPSGTRRGPRP